MCLTRSDGMAGMVAVFDKGKAGKISDGLSELPDCIIVEAGNITLEGWMGQQQR